MAHIDESGNSFRQPFAFFAPKVLLKWNDAYQWTRRVEEVSITIYIEHAILDNMVVNSLLLYFTLKTVKSRVSKWRIFLSALVGTAFALLLPLLHFNGIASVAVRLFIGAFMIFIIQSRSVKRFTLAYLIFLTYTFAFGGMVFGILSMWAAPVHVPIGMVLGVAVVFALIMRLLVKYLNVRHSMSNHLQDVVIHHKGERFKILSYMDTGNRLTDPASGSPVVIISLSLFFKMFPEVDAGQLVLGKLDKNSGIENGRYIPFTTVGQEGKMFTFSPQKLEIEKGKTYEDVRLGVSMKGFRDVVKYDALLNANLV